MKLEKRKYKKIDILRLPFKVAPFTMILQIALTIIDAIVPTFVMALATAFFVDTAISVFEGGAATSAIYLPLGILVALVGVVSLLGGLPQIIESRIKFALERNLTPAILDVQASLAYKHIEDAASWELIERVADEMTETFLDGIRSYGAVIRSVIATISVLGLIVTQVWWSGLVVIAFSVPLFWVSLWAGRKNYAAKVQTRKYERRYSYYSDEVLTNREAVEERTLFGYADDVTKRYYEHFEISRDIQLKVLLKTHIAMKSTSLSLILITLVTAFTFIKPVIAGDVSPGMFMGIVTALFGMAETLGWQLQDAAKNISESKGYTDDLTSFVELDRAEGATDLPDEQPIAFESLEFVNVRFKYPKGEEYILDGLSFKLERGKHYAFVGANGVGKTTITKLLTGLYDEYEGEILINGKELREYSASAIKALSSLVYQDFARYQISMADNIAFGDTAREIDKRQILDIASKAGLNNTISNLPNGINTPLGRINNDGLDISGGQWQKIAVARSLLSRAPIKILDEPTSALDPIAENQIYQEFEELMKGKTTIFISHRLGSTKLADEIFVIDNGSIVEKGCHSELIRSKGLYAQMFETQRKWYR
ncbi:ATP-binding cassette subfamily B protein [Sporosarcina luteola]|nr:ATP-binding cassette subfamily B protein [Sporosarcina luteola]